MEEEEDWLLELSVLLAELEELEALDELDELAAFSSSQSSMSQPVRTPAVITAAVTVFNVFLFIFRLYEILSLFFTIQIRFLNYFLFQLQVFSLSE